MAPSVKEEGFSPPARPLGCWRTAELPAADRGGGPGGATVLHDVGGLGMRSWPLVAWRDREAWIRGLLQTFWARLKPGLAPRRSTR